MPDEVTLEVRTYSTVTVVKDQVNRMVDRAQLDDMAADTCKRKLEREGYRAIEAPRVEWYRLTEEDVALKQAMLAEHGFPPGTWQAGDWLVTVRCRCVRH